MDEATFSVEESQERWAALEHCILTLIEDSQPLLVKNRSIERTDRLLNVALVCQVARDLVTLSQAAAVIHRRWCDVVDDD